MPVSRMSVGKCADYAIHRKSSGDGRVFIHIHMIVEIDEIVPERLTKNQPSDRDQNKARERCEP